MIITNTTRRKFFALLVGGCLVFNSKGGNDGGNDEYFRTPFVGGDVVSGVPNCDLSQLPGRTDMLDLNGNEINEQMSIGGIGAPFVGGNVVPGVHSYNLSQLRGCASMLGLNDNKINEQMPVGNGGRSVVINNFFVFPKFGNPLSNNNIEFFGTSASNGKYTGNAVIDNNNAMICSNILGIGDARNDAKWKCKTQKEKSFSCVGEKRNRETWKKRRKNEELEKSKALPKGAHRDSNIRQVIKTCFNRSIIILLNKLLEKSHIEEFEKMKNDYLVKSKSDLTSKREERSKNLGSSSEKLIDREVKVKRKENFVKFFLDNNTSRKLSYDRFLFSKKVSEVICFSNKIVKHDIDRNKVLCNKINGYFNCNSG